MSTRYSRVFTLSSNLHTDGSPVLIAAGALLKDNETGNTLVQLKLRNISKETLKAVKVKVNAYDISTEPLEGVEAFSYLDLSAKANDEFGQKTPIILPNATTRSFSVEILSVVYANGKVFSPELSSVAQAATKEVLEEVRRVDAEIKAANAAASAEIAKQKKYQRILKTHSFVAFACVAFSFVLPAFGFIRSFWEYLYSFAANYLGDDFWRFFMQWFPKAISHNPFEYISALVVPITCLFIAFKLTNNRNILKVSLIICTTMCAIQIGSILVVKLFPQIFSGYHLNRYIHGAYFLIHLQYAIQNANDIFLFIGSAFAVLANLLPSVALMMYYKKTK